MPVQETLRHPFWLTTAFILLAFLGLYWSLTSTRRKGMILGLSLALVGLGVQGMFLLWVTTGLPWVDVGTLIFAGLACGAAFLIIAVRDPLYAALSFAVCIVAISGLFLVYSAEFVMAATIIIYTGAIVVTFLFVVMLARQADHSTYDFVPREPVLACIGGFLLSTGLGMPLFQMAAGGNLQYKIDGIESANGKIAERELGKLTKQALRSLQPIKHAIRETLPKEKIIRLLMDGTADIPSLMDVMDKIIGREWVRNGFLQRKLKELRAAYDQLAGTLALEPVDYDKCESLVSALEHLINNLNETITGHYVLTKTDVRSSTRGIGQALYSYFSVPIQLAGWLLLLATVGTYLIGASGQQLATRRG